MALEVIISSKKSQNSLKIFCQIPYERVVNTWNKLPHDGCLVAFKCFLLNPDFSAFLHACF